MSDSDINKSAANSLVSDMGVLRNLVNSNNDVMGHTVNVVSSYLSRNKVGADDVIDIMKNVYNSVVAMERIMNLKFSHSEPAVPIEESVHEDYIICLEDGKKLKVLKKHLRTSYNMTPEEYRAKWKLPASYPMVAPKYTRKRSDLAKLIGLGKNKKK